MNTLGMFNADIKSNSNVIVIQPLRVSIFCSMKTINLYTLLYVLTLFVKLLMNPLSDKHYIKHF